MSERHFELSDEALARKLATELPRHPAPPSLRAAVVQATTPAPPRVWWWSPVLASAATALVLMLFFMPLLPRIVPPDPVQRLTRAVVSEHSRVIMWGTRGPEIVPAAFPWLAQETGITLNNVFWGDDRVAFVGAEPVYLDQRRGVALHYRDGDGHQLTYIVLPAPELRVPERQRVRIDRWRPALVHDGGFSVWVWKQGELACFLVSDMVSETDVANFKDYFARVRAATEPKPAY